MRSAFLVALLCSLPLSALAEVPRVAADIAPVHSLVARVMQGVGAPDLVLPPGASPHSHAMRPSEARALERADIVFWVGEGLTPWLAGPVATLAADAVSIELLEAEGTRLRAFREEPGHDDGHDQDHDHGPTDPHAWFDPENAAHWLDVIAAELAAADPANATAYRANAAAGAAELAALSAELKTILAPVRDVPLILYHEAFGYFEDRFGLVVAGAMTTGETAPSPRRIALLRDIAAAGAVCVVVEPQVGAGLAEAVLQGRAAPVVTVDPQGTALQPGAGFYPALLRSVAAALAGCA